MTDFVYTSGGGQRYHATKDCNALTGGQNLNDWDCECWGRCSHRSPRAVVPLEPAAAAARGKLPCRVCYPSAVDLGPSQDDFGHQQTSWGGRRICTRCATGRVPEAPDSPDPLASPDRSVAWPCATAVVLGLAPRSAA
jgi:hypothetical protein